MFKKKITAGILRRIQKIFRSKSTQLGLDIDRGSVIFVQLCQKAADHFLLENFAVEKWPAEALANGQANDTTALETALKLIKEKAPAGAARVAIPIATNQVATIKTSVSRRLPEDQKFSHASTELKRAFPDGYEDLYYDFVLEDEENGDENKQTMLLLATQKSHVDDLLKAAQSSGLVIETLDVDAYCIARAFPLIQSPLAPGAHEGAVAIANLDTSGVLLVVMKDGKLLYYKKEMVQAPQLEKEIIACFTPGAKADCEAARVLIETLRQMLDLAPTEIENIALVELVLAGRCTLLPQFSALVSEMVSPLPVRVANPFAKMERSASVPSEGVNTYSSAALLACGLAMHQGRTL